MINTNVRRVKRSEHGLTMLTAPQTKVIAESLCDRCGLQDACEILKTVQSQRVQLVRVLECEWYQFPLKFINKSGTEGKGWNTIRLGSAWSNRVKEGDVVALIDSRNRKYGEAKVQKVVLDITENIIQLYGEDNHCALDVADDQKVSTVRSALLSSYGSSHIASAIQSTAIYLDTI